MNAPCASGRKTSLCRLSGLSALVSALVSASAAPAETTPDVFSGPVPEIRIEIPDEGMRVLRRYRQVWGQPRPERVDVRATVREGGRVYTNVAVHLKGSYTFQPVDAQPSLTLNFDKFAKGQLFHGLDKIHLNNSVQDPTYIHEALAREVFNAAGVPTPRAGHATVSLNGRNLGFYVLVEGGNKRFLRRHYTSVRGNLYDGGSGGDLNSSKLDVDSGENPDDRGDLQAIIAATREANPTARFAKLEQLLDVDRFLTYAALEVLFVHWDGYVMAGNNYHVFHDAERGKMIFMPRGMDQILGFSSSTSLSIRPQWKGMVARALLSTAEGSRRYEQHLRELLAGEFSAEKLNARVDRIAARIRPAAAPGFLAGFPFQARVSSLKSRIGQRLASAEAQLARPDNPVAFPASGVMPLTGWRFRNGQQGESSGREVADERGTMLEIRASGEGGSGSWRKTVLLGPGSYEFQGSGKVGGLPDGVAESGVLLRISGERSTGGLSTAGEWKPLRYRFEMGAAGNVELVCEYRGTEGVGWFDAGSLRLVKR